MTRRRSVVVRFTASRCWCPIPSSAVTPKSARGLVAVPTIRAAVIDLPDTFEEMDGPRPNTGRQVAVDAFAALPEPVRAYLIALSVTVIDLYTNGEPMVPCVQASKLDLEGQLGLWSLLPSYVRSQYKRELAEFYAKA